ncbi:WW domain-binding protein 4 [Sinocyclocheilus anshuiensis]|uniref:WW domain-binding protein 4 n=1 Tax=Sinocyclocheilus anshuiensis TaxID=1608454 RepID=UPI0007BAB390|nr:PREDICTED: WW domain-binding protein 4 [Sinocyclocheilus anshuiensis]XP_016309168.1 PREDICTED: WW domain-binding protein 4 [Sinocyclocheilus anshuiensis]XP_016309170.1 PREDICTED: WW domain-binding protein 4 [Sinocyclocheilus anshuiensis]
MSKEFAAMEEAALKAYEEDLKRLAAQSSGESVAPSEAPVKKQKKPKKLKASVPSESSGGGRPDVWLRGTTNNSLLYYYNTVTGESQWEKPDGFVDESSSSAAGQAQDPSGGAWMEAVSPDGYMYYYNTERGESSWEKPDDLNSEDVAPPGVESPREETRAAEDLPPPQPESVSGAEDTSDPPKDTPEPDETKQTSLLKTSFRKRKEELVQTSADDGGERSSDDGGSGEEKREDSAVTDTVKKDETPVKRPRKTNPYGAWEQIQPQEDPYEKVDLQLPQVESVAQTPADVPPEPRARFRERTITSLGAESSAGATFKKRKTENGKSRSLRQRETDE